MEPRATSQERRLVTVLFADVTGSTALAESLDPEDVSALLERFFRIARESIESHGGTVEKFIGDAVVAVFGLPVAHGDDANRASAAAGDDASLGADGRFTGDSVNVAARLQQGAAVWGIVAGCCAKSGIWSRSTATSSTRASRWPTIPSRGPVTLPWCDSYADPGN